MLQYNNDDIVILSSKRSPLGAFGGIYKTTLATDIAAHVLKGMIDEFKHTKLLDTIDGICIGNVLSANLGQGPARHVLLKSGIKNSISCSSVNKVCGSGLIAVTHAAMAIKSGYKTSFIAGGMENMSMAPYMIANARFGSKFGNQNMVDHMMYDGLFDCFLQANMGEIAEINAEKYELSKEMQDAYTIKTCEKAIEANKNNKFKNEIINIAIRDKNICDDETLNNINIEKIPNLRSAFKKNGTITAASASSIADGAALSIITKYQTAHELGIQPIARIVGFKEYATEPVHYITAPVEAIKNMLVDINWDINEVDVFEINEAFAIVPMCVAKMLDISFEKINIYGGSCALGHPLGASGCRVLTTLLNVMKQENKKRGIVALCVGGGEGVCMAVEML